MIRDEKILQHWVQLSTWHSSKVSLSLHGLSKMSHGLPEHRHSSFSPIPFSSLLGLPLGFQSLFPFLSFAIFQLTHPSSVAFISGSVSRRKMETDWRKVGSRSRSRLREGKV